MKKNPSRKRPEPGGLTKKTLGRCGPGIRRLLKMKDKEIIKRKKNDIKRLNLFLDDYKKISKKIPGTKQSFQRELRAVSHRIYGPVIVNRHWRIPIKIRAIVEFLGNRDDLKNMGINVKTAIQNVFTITATKSQLTTLASQAATQKIRLPRLFFPNLQDSVPTAEIDQVHALGNRGNGTIVGIIDSPLHVGHHAFRDPAGTHDTRVRYYWVQDPDTLAGGAQPPGQTPEDYFNDNVNHPNSPDFTGLDYGRIYDADYIDAALAGGGAIYGTSAGEIAKEHSPLDSWGNPTAEHGTHVAGIAAGNGSLNNWAAGVNTGAAPLAEIVFVNSRWSHANLQDGTWEDDIINALDFIMRIAAHEGRPVVTNTSLGTGVGPHNGKSAFDQARDALLDSFQGRSIVFAAGNDNNDEGFRKGTVGKNSTENFDLDPKGWNINDNWVDIWYKGPDLDFKMDSGTDTTNWIAPPNDFAGVVNGYDIEIDRDVEPNAGLKCIRFYIDNAGANWTINLRNNSNSQDVEYWAWVGGQGNWADLDGFTIDEMTLSDTCCAKSIIAVGACEKPVGANVELIADYSGRGPTLDGRIKPEIVAVGSDVFSADSRTDGGYIDMTGTSMAAPLTAGAIALLLEDQPLLNQDAIKGLLTQNADRTNLDIDPQEPGFDEKERNAYGYGRLRMLNPFQFIQPPGDVDVWVRTAQDDYGLEPYPGDCFCHAPEIRIFDSNDIETNTLEWGKEHTVTVRIHNLGDANAVHTTVKIKYTRPWAAPDDWVPCQDSTNTNIEEDINVPALFYNDMTFTQKWVPDLSQLPAGGDEWGNHYCILIELEHNDDQLVYDDSTAIGKDPWIRNIKGTNNVALRNLHIQ